MYLMTSEQLVKYGREYIKKGTRYGKGMQGCTIVKSNITKKANQYPTWYRNANESSFVNYGKKTGAKNWEDYLLGKVGKGYLGADCCGWIKAVEYGNRASGPTTLYVGSMDLTIKSMAEGCKETSTDKSKLVVGMFMWSDDYSHCAIFSGNGKDIESAPSLDGMQEVPINYQQGKSKLTHWGKLPWVDYGQKPIVVGSKVRIKSGAVYGGSAKGVPVPSKYCGNVYTVDKVQKNNGQDEARIKELVSWVALKYLELA